MIDSKLYTLLSVFEENSFTKAAQKLNLTQPAVSQQIRQLEEMYGCRIFERKSRDLTVTKEGEMIIRTAYRLRAVDEELRRNLSGRTSQASVYAVGIDVTLEDSMVTEILASFARDRDLSFRIVTGSTEKLKEMLLSGELDFIVVEERIRNERLKVRVLDVDCLLLIVPPDHPLARKKNVPVERVQQEKLIVRRLGTGVPDLTQSVLARHGLSKDDFNIIMEMDNVSSIRDLVRRGHGVSILPKSTCAEELKYGKLAGVRIRDISIDREVTIACATDFRDEDMVMEIISAYRECL